MAAAQQIVLKVDAKDIDSVEKSLDAVNTAVNACERAGRSQEKAELIKARNQLSSQVDYLKKKASRREQRKLTPEQLASFVKSGDPGCPKGQAYKHRDSGKEIRCAGPQIAELSYKDAKDYFDGRGYKITAEPPATLKTEYGAELFVFTYTTVDDPNPPTCVTIYPAPGTSWQEETARATGVPPQRLKAPGTVSLRRGSLPLDVEDSQAKVIIRIGQCSH